MTKYEESKYSKKETINRSKEEKQRMFEILNLPEVYDFSKFKKTRTVQSDELNFYIPEKWKR